MEATLLYSIALGIGLSAACGFRIFVPFLLLSGAVLLGEIELASDFAWLGTYEALAVFAVATGLEILGYSIPWVDNALDTIATPVAVVAGILASASVLGEAEPLTRWVLSIVSGGGVAGIIQGGTVAARGTSSATTGGLGNFLIAAGEALASVVTVLVAIVFPLVAVLAIFVLCVLTVRRLLRLRRGKASEHSTAPR